MAELIQQRLETMIPDLEYFETKGVFTRKEIKDIVRKREECEYLLQPRVQDSVYLNFVRTIEYEQSLEALRVERMKKMEFQNETAEVFRHIMSIRNRIKQLYTRGMAAVTSQTEQKALFTAFTQFLKDTRNKQVLASVHGKVVQRSPTDEFYWIHAADWEMSEGNITNARVVLQQALRINRTSRALYIAYFHLEMQYVQTVVGTRLKMLTRQQLGQTKQQDIIPPDRALLEVALGRLPKLVFDHAVSQPTLESDVAFYLQFQIEAAKFPFSTEMQSSIWWKTIQRFPGNAECLVAYIGRVFEFAAKQNVSQKAAFSGTTVSHQVNERMIFQEENERAVLRNLSFALQRLPIAATWTHVVRLLSEELIPASSNPLLHTHLLPYVYQKALAAVECPIPSGTSSNDAESMMKLAQACWLADVLDPSDAPQALQTKIDPPTIDPSQWDVSVAWNRMPPAPAFSDATSSSSPSPSSPLEALVQQTRKRKREMMPKGLLEHTKVETTTATTEVLVPLCKSGLDPQLYCRIIDYLWQNCHRLDAALEVAQKALDFHPTDLSLWTECLRLLVRRKETDAAAASSSSSSSEPEMWFRKALKKMEGSVKQVPIWELYLQYHALGAANQSAQFEDADEVSEADVAHVAQMHKRFQEAIGSILRITADSDRETLRTGNFEFDKEQVLGDFSAQYIDFMVTRGTPKDLEKTYQYVLQCAGVPLRIFQKVIAIERSKVRSQPTVVRGLFERMAQRFGKEIPEMWLEWVEYEHSEQQFERVQVLHYRAMRTLSNPAPFTLAFKEWNESKAS